MFVLYDGAEDPYHAAVENFLQNDGLHQRTEDWFDERLRWPEFLGVFSFECGFANAFYWRDDEGNPGIGMCYELWRSIAETFGLVFTQGEAAPLTYDTWMFILFHELGHALIDVSDLPVVAAEEDIVDAFSVVLLVAGGRPDAALSAAYYWFLADDNSRIPEVLADEHSIDAQRFYNTLCLVYGSDPTGYAWISEDIPEMEHRLARCPDEWAQASASWEELLADHLR